MTPFSDLNDLGDESSRSSIWMHRNNGFGALGREYHVQISLKFDYQGRICLKVEITLFAILIEFDYQGRIYLKLKSVFS